MNKFMNVTGTLALGFVIGVTFSTKMDEAKIDSLRVEAVKRGVAEWVIIPPHSKPEFQWRTRP